jgi:serine protease Do
MDAQTARQLGLPPNTSGVVVTGINPSSRAAGAGLQRGDVIQEVNRQSVKTSSDFERAMRNSKDETLLLVNRRGSTLYVTV